MMEKKADEKGTESVYQDGPYVVFNEGEELPVGFLEKVIQLLKNTAKREGVSVELVNLILSGDSRLEELNKNYRSLDKTTDVLSFDLKDSSNNKVEGEIYINANQARQYAKLKNEYPETDIEILVENELLQLSVHGFLHLCGWEHKDDVSLKLMIERGEKEIDMVKSRS